MKIIEAINGLISTVALVYFAYGTWRIDSRLTAVKRSEEKQEELLTEIRDIMVEIKREDL